MIEVPAIVKVLPLSEAIEFPSVFVPVHFVSVLVVPEPLGYNVADCVMMFPLESKAKTPAAVPVNEPEDVYWLKDT